MRVVGLNKLIPRGVAILTFGIGLFVALVVSSIFSPPKDNSRVVAILKAARESAPVLDPAREPFASDHFLILQQSVRSPAITETVPDSFPEYDLIEHDCGTLYVSIDHTRNLMLNTDDVGTL